MLMSVLDLTLKVDFMSYIGVNNEMCVGAFCNLMAL